MTGTLAADVAHEQRVSPGLLASLGLLGTIGPFATDVYLSTFPTMFSNGTGFPLQVLSRYAPSGLSTAIRQPFSSSISMKQPRPKTRMQQQTKTRQKKRSPHAVIHQPLSVLN